MKTVRTIISILALSAILFSCEKKEDNISITAFEDQLHKAVNNYRSAAGLNSLTHNFDILSKESKAHAAGRANGTIADDKVYEDIQQRWHTIEGKLGVNNVSNEQYLPAIVLEPITSANAGSVAAAVVNLWAADSIGKIILEGDYTIHGPGEAKTSDGRTYIMHLLCKFTQQ